jgi:hypothetical protein
MRKLIFILPLLAACASDPSRIHAIHNPGVKCDRSKLTGLEAAQRKTARADTVGVLLIGIPLGGEDYAKEIAELKGACNA